MTLHMPTTEIKQNRQWVFANRWGQPILTCDRRGSIGTIGDARGLRTLGLLAREYLRGSVCVWRMRRVWLKPAVLFHFG